MAQNVQVGWRRTQKNVTSAQYDVSGSIAGR